MSVLMDTNLNAANMTPAMNYYEAAKREIDSWYFVDNTWPVVLILISYVLFIYVDLKFLKQRKPMNLKYVMLAFDIYQVVTNAQIAYLCLLPDSIDYLTNHACHPVDPTKNHLWSRGLLAGKLFLTSKLADLIDTVFIVLRKKESQVSFLHLYHHFSMVIFAWYCMKYAAGEQLVIIMIVNPLVHVIMYSYYALSLMGKSIQKYLWWKKYVTILQLSQFVVYMAYMAAMVLFGCEQSVPLSLFVFLQAYIFYALFKDFYIKNYMKKEIQSEADPGANKKAKVT